MVIQRVTGTLNPGAHPGGANGQDAYNDLLIPTGGGIDGLPTTRSEILCLLRETYGEETILQWGTDVLGSLQQAEILWQGVHERGVQREAEKGNKLDDSTLPCPESVANWLLRDMRERSECGCSPYRWESTEQRFVESSKAMPELPYKSAPTAEDLFDMWAEGKGLWVLQQTLYQIQEIRRSNDGRKGGDRMKDVSAKVRRLTPL